MLIVVMVILASVTVLSDSVSMIQTTMSILIAVLILNFYISKNFDEFVGSLYTDNGSKLRSESANIKATN